MKINWEKLMLYTIGMLFIIGVVGAVTTIRDTTSDFNRATFTDLNATGDISVQGDINLTTAGAKVGGVDWSLNRDRLKIGTGTYTNKSISLYRFI